MPASDGRHPRHVRLGGAVSAVEPLIPAIVAGIHTACSIGTGATFVVGIVTALLAALIVAQGMPAGRIGEREPAGRRARATDPEPALD